MIEERLESLIERYTIEIEDQINNLKKYKDELENVLKESDCLSMVDNSRIGSLVLCNYNSEFNIVYNFSYKKLKKVNEMLENCE